MSYDLFAGAFEGGNAVPRPEARPAILDVLRPFIVTGPDEFGVCRTRTVDGGGAVFYLDSDRAGFLVNHFSTGDTMDLIVRAASAGGLVIYGPGLPAILTDARQLAELPEALRDIEFGPPVLVGSGDELQRIIDGGD